MKLFEFNGPSPSAAQPQSASAAPVLDPKARAGAAAVSRALGGKVDTKFAQAIDRAEQGKALPPALLKSIAPFAGALEKIFADPAMRTKFLAMVKSVQTQESVTEDQDSVDAVAGAITRRIMSQHLDLLSKYGPVKVMAAIDDVADFAGSDGLEEIGSSDVSIWTKQVIQDLEAGRFDHMESVQEAEGDKPYICLYVKKDKVLRHECYAPTSYEAAKKAAQHWGLKSTAGVSAHLADDSDDVKEAEEDAVDTVTMDVPLLLRMMEYAREDAQEDMDLHGVAERMIAMAKDGPLSMDDYDSIVGNVEALPAPDKVGEDSGKSKQYIEIISVLGHTKRVPVHPLNAYKALNHYRDQPSTKSARIVSENYYTPGPETMPGAVGPQENTTISFNQSKTVGDATLNISASAKDMEELHRILKLAGIDYNAAGEKEEPSMKDVAVALEPHMPEEPAEEPCGCDDADVAIPMVPGPRPLDLKYTTDKTALINAIKDKLAQRLS